MVSGTISPPYSGYFSPFPHGTCSLSVSQEYLALPDGAGGFRRDFTGPALLRVPLDCRILAPTGLSPSAAGIPIPFEFALGIHVAALQPRASRNWPGLGCFPFARHYLGNHYCFLFLRVLRCFSSPGWPSRQVGSVLASPVQVVPFGYPRINSYVPIPVAFRSLSRPSSPLRA